MSFSSQLPRWIPLSIMNGGGPANTLVRSLDSGWGRKLFSNIIIRGVAEGLYRVSASIPNCCATVHLQLARPGEQLWYPMLRKAVRTLSWPCCDTSQLNRIMARMSIASVDTSSTTVAAGQAEAGRPVQEEHPRAEVS